ncbi:GNAT family N-acetyltransferase [Mesobaculum littorinae]|nr:GNAT family N-acetyltransferase [Mesobaculum littorinae]
MPTDSASHRPAVASSRGDARATAGLRIDVIKWRDAFDALAPAWTALHARSRATVYADHGFLSAWLESYGRDAALRVVTAHRDGRLVGALPLMAGPARALLPLGEGRLGFAGLLLPPLTPGTHPEERPEAVLAALLRGFGRGRYLRLDPVERADADMIARAARDAGLALQRREVIQGDSVALTGGIEAYLATRSKSQRRLIRRAEKAHEAPGFAWTETADDPEGALEGYLAVARTSWKAAAGTGFGADAAGAAFLRGLAHRLGPDRARFGALHDGQTPVCGYFALRDGDTWLAVSHEFNETYAKSSPGRLALHRVSVAAAAAGMSRVDFMRTSKLNQELATDSRPLDRVILHRRFDPAAVLGWESARALRGLRRRLRRWSGAKPGPRAAAQAKSATDTPRP